MKSVRVPGKVMLWGEYAVLHGGTAVLVPVPRYLTVTEAQTMEPERQSPIIRTALDFQMEETDEFEQVHCLPGVSIDHREFSARGADGNLLKLGLGSSAAEAVGIIALRFERAGLGWSENRETIASYADIVHRKVQGGIGSGADIAVCAYREPVSFKKDQNSCAINPLPKPEYDIPLHLVWTGQPADTRQLVRDFDTWLSRGEPASADLLANLMESSHEVAGVWFRSSVDVLFACIDRFCSALRECMEAANIPHRLPIHDRLESWAKEHGGRAKPTGAGGGDMILLVGDLPVNELDKMVIPIHV
jgi:mevalonate kinase